MLEALGWDLGPADREYAEAVNIRAINARFIAVRRFDALRARRCLEQLPQPWVVKDPRFCHTMALWAPLLAPFAPLLLWVTKDIHYVRQSIRRRFQASPAKANRRLRLCEKHFNEWPYAKLKLDVEQISRAVALFDPARPFAKV